MMWMLLIFAIGSHEPVKLVINGHPGNPMFRTEEACDASKAGIAEGYYGECKPVQVPNEDEAPGESL